MLRHRVNRPPPALGLLTGPGPAI